MRDRRGSVGKGWRKRVEKSWGMQVDCRKAELFTRVKV